MRTLTKFLGVATAGLATAIAMSGAASASTTHTLSDDGYGGCQKPTNGTWTTYGAYSHVHITDQVVYNSSTSIHINYSDMDGDLSDCGPAGRLVTGGSYSYSDHWEADGIGLTTCTISAGGGCTISGGTVAQHTYSHSGSNTAGTVSFHGGGWNIYAKSTGIIDDWEHDCDVTFTYSSWATAAGSSNIYYF